MTKKKKINKKKIKKFRINVDEIPEEVEAENLDEARKIANENIDIQDEEYFNEDIEE